MKNLILKTSLAIVTFLGLTTVISCGDDNSSSGGGMDSTKRIASMKMVEPDYKTYYYNYEYDTEGRISRVTVDEYYTSSGKLSQSYYINYTYSGNKIVKQSNNSSYSYNLVVSNGRVERDGKYNAEYKYDDSGYLSSGRGKSFTWSDGNLTQYSSHKYTYSSIPWPKNYFFFWDGTGMDQLLEPAGFYGNMPKNLPATVDNTYSLNYTIENGCITKVVWKNINNDKEDYVYTLVWK